MGAGKDFHGYCGGVFRPVPESKRLGIRRIWFISLTDKCNKLSLVGYMGYM